AAEKAYVAYARVSDEIGNQGGSDAARLTPFVTADWLTVELTSYAQFAKTGDSFAGSTSFTTFKLQRNEETAHGANITVYVCVNLTRTREIDKAGKDVTPSTRVDIYPVVVAFTTENSESQTLRVAGNRPWSGKNFCS
ncbi:MAG TPA: hypothetical protein VGI56_14000, partial [Galbitalea sp.]